MRKKVRFLLAGLLVADVLLIGYLMYDYIQNKIPDSVLTYVGEKQELDLPAFFKTEQSVPALHVQNQDGSFSMKSNRLGSYEVSVRLFGVLPVKRMDVKVVKGKRFFRVESQLVFMWRLMGCWCWIRLRSRQKMGLLMRPVKIC